jgi:HTH-type transcriptional regulator/antitoxin HigA
MKYKKIHSSDVYNEYCDLHEKLGLEDEQKYKDEIDLLEILIDEYDSRLSTFHKNLNPVELLDSILKDENISMSDLAEELGVTRQLVSDILRYRRNISKKMIDKLSKRFAMRPEAFSRPYKLKLAKSKMERQRSRR